MMMTTITKATSVCCEKNSISNNNSADSKERNEKRRGKVFFSNPLKTTINFHFNGKAMTICGVSKWKIKAMNLKAKNIVGMSCVYLSSVASKIFFPPFSIF